MQELNSNELENINGGNWQTDLKAAGAILGGAALAGAGGQLGKDIYGGLKTGVKNFLNSDIWSEDADDD